MKITNYFENSNISVINSKGCFKVCEYETDLSLSTAGQAMASYYMSIQNVKKRQPVAELTQGSGILLSKGALQMSAGNIKCATNVKSVGDLVGKFIKGKVTGEAGVKPRYWGDGTVFLEPSYRHYLLVDVAEKGNIVISDGMFMACEDTVELKVVMMKSVSGAIFGGEGLFNLCLRGKGIALLESSVPMEELILFDLHNDELKIDGSYAVMWDDELDFTVERSSRTLIGSTVTGEGLLNVYRGTGRVWVSPVEKVSEIFSGPGSK